MPELQQVRASHAADVLAFERENRSYFAASISDRGDDFFDRFAERFDDLLADQAAGTSAFYVLVEPSGEVVGRFNLYDIADGAATIGYRVAHRVAGRGVATTAVINLCELATGLGVGVLTAAVSHDNVASGRVLEKAGFVPIGVARPSELGGKQGIRYRRHLAP